jgi:hypothetical protein
MVVQTVQLAGLLTSALRNVRVTELSRSRLGRDTVQVASGYRRSEDYSKPFRNAGNHPQDWSVTARALHSSLKVCHPVVLDTKHGGVGMSKHN